MLWHSFTKFHTEMHLGWLQGPVDFQGQRSNNYVTRSQDRSNGYRGVKSISILSQYMQSYWFSKQSSINIIYNISVITITITMSIISANFGKYAISDCPFICLFVGARRDTGRIVWAINTKLGINMEHTCEKVCILFGVDDITDDVTRSKSRSNLKIVITQSIFELELRSKAQNVGYCTGYLDDIPNFRWHLWRKSSPRPQIFVSFENVAIFNIACIWQQVSNDSM